MPVKISAAKVWEAVTAGYTTCAQVAEALNVSRSQVATYLRVMTEVGLLTMSVEQTQHGNMAATTHYYKPNYDAAREMGW